MSRLATLKGEFSDITGAIDSIERAAVERGTDLNDTEQADVDALYARAGELKPVIEAEALKLDNVAAVSNILAKHNDAPISRAVKSHEDMSAGECPQGRICHGADSGQHISMLARAAHRNRRIGCRVGSHGLPLESPT